MLGCCGHQCQCYHCLEECFGKWGFDLFANWSYWDLFPVGEILPGGLVVHSANCKLTSIHMELGLILQITSNLKTPLSTARASALQSFASEAATNQALIANAAAVPQAIGTGFGYTIHDLRSIGNGQWGASAPMEAALIYFVGSS